MHFVRKIDQDKYDVRSRAYYIYECALCQHKEWLSWVPNFDTVRLRKCPNCGVENDTTNEEYQIKRKHDIEQRIKKLTDEIGQLSKELNSFKEKSFSKILVN